MPGKSATLVIKILADAVGAQKGLADVEGSVGGAAAKVEKLAVPAGVALGAVLALGKGTSDAASDVEQSFGAVDSVFKDTADATKSLAREAADANGLSAAQYAQMASILGAQLKGMGTSADELSAKTDGLIDIGSDLAATFGGETSDAVSAVSALLRGERDPIERYGVSIKEADVAAQKAAMGLSGLTGEADKQATATATLALLTAQTADAQGQFARESDSAAHAQQLAAAESANAAAAIGEALLPAVVLLSSAMSAGARFATEHKTVILALGVAVAVIAGTILALNVAMKVAQGVQLAMRAATLAWTAAQWLLNAALSANPIGIVVIALLALAALFVVLWTRSETFRRIVTTVFQAVQSVIGSAVDFITRLFSTIAATLSKPFEQWLDAVRRVIGAVQGLFAGLSKTISGILDAVGNLAGKIGDVLGSLPKLPFGLAASAAPGGNAPAVHGLRAARAADAGVPSRGVTINVYTTGDSLDAEQGVMRALRRQTRLNGGVVPAFGWSGAK